MGVLDQLPQGEPLALLRGVNRDLDELKGFQKLGSSSVVTGRLYSASSFDVQTPSSGTPVVEVIFTPDDMTFGGAFAYKLVVVDVTGTPAEVTTGIYRQRVGSDNLQKWRIAASTNQKLKFYFLTAGYGTFTANVI